MVRITLPKGAVAQGVSNYPKYFVFASLYVCRLFIRTWVLIYLEWLPFVFCFSPSFHTVWLISHVLSKSYNFLCYRYRRSSPPMVTFYTPKCCKLHDDSFPLYCATESGTKNYCARLCNDVRHLTSRSNGMPSKKIMESFRTFVFVETVLRRGQMFQSSDEVWNPLLYHAE